jgi:hypothetical protein
MLRIRVPIQNLPKSRRVSYYLKRERKHAQSGLVQEAGLDQHSLWLPSADVCFDGAADDFLSQLRNINQKTNSS